MKKQSIKNISKKALGLAIIYIFIKWTLIIGLGSLLYKMGLWKKEYLLVFPLIAGSIFSIKSIYKRKKAVLENKR